MASGWRVPAALRLRSASLHVLTASVALTALTLLASTDSAAQHGVNLSWDDCGAHGTALKTFACDVNTGVPFSLVGSFVPPAGITNLLGMNGELRIASTQLPQWWKHGVGQCRSTNSLSTQFSFLSATCPDAWIPSVVGGQLYTLDAYGANSASLRITCAVPIGEQGPVDPGTEYAAFRVNVLRGSTVGPSACAGCADPVRIRLENVQLFQRPEDGFDPVLSAELLRKEASWQAEIGGLPDVVAFTPTAAAPGQSVTITGDRFTAANTVSFGGVATAATVVSDEEVHTTVPAGARSGNVVLSTPFGDDAGVQRFVVAPSISRFMPHQAPAGTPVSVHGRNFDDVTAVDFNGVGATFTVESESLLTATVPAGAGTGPIRAHSPGGSAVSVRDFVTGVQGGAANLRWDDCGVAGTSLKSFACDTDFGTPFTLVGSFVPPAGVSTYQGSLTEIRVDAEDGSLPDWWRVGAAHCRGGAGFGTSVAFTGISSTCLNPYPFGGGADYLCLPEFYGPGTAQIRLSASVFTAGGALDPRNEYFAFKLLVQRTRTTSCDGCTEPARITLQRLTLSPGAGDYVITDSQGLNEVVWQPTDDTPPTVSFTGGPGENASVGTTSQTITWTGLDETTPFAGLQFRYRLDAGLWSPWSGLTSATFSGLSERAHFVDVAARDAAGNETTPPARRNWIVDLTDPETQIVAPAESETLRVAHADFVFSGTDNVDPAIQLQYAWRLDGGPYSSFNLSNAASADSLADGLHVLEVKAKDSAGNEDDTPASRSFVVRGIPPVPVFVDGPAEGGYSNGAPAFTWSLGSFSPAAPRAGITFAYALDGAGFSPESPDTTHVFAGLTEGSHTLVVRATDDAGLTGTVSLTWTVDVSPPVLGITVGPADGAHVASDEVAFEFSAVDLIPTGLAYSWRLDEGEWSPFTSTTSAILTGLAEGSHRFEVRARDAVGNVTTTGCSFDVTGLVAWWPANGGVADVWGGHATAASGGVAYASGVRGQAFAFSGTGHVQADGAADLLPRTGSFTVEAWIRKTAGDFTGLPEGIVARGDDEGARTRYVLRHLGDGGIEFRVKANPTATGAGQAIVTYDVTLDDEQWHHLAGVRDMAAGRLRLYVDGVEAASTAVNSQSNGDLRDTLGVSPLLVGAGTFAGAVGDRFRGTIDEVVYSSRAIGAAEINQIWASGGRAPCADSTAARAFVVDLTAPETEVASGPADGARITTATPVFVVAGGDSLTPAGSLRFRWRLDSGALSAPDTTRTIAIDPLPDGPHAFEVIAVDLAGNADATPARRDFIVHAVPPTVSVLSGPAEGSYTSNGSAVFAWTLASRSPAADRALITWSYQLDGGPFAVEGPDTTLTLTGLAAGSHTLVVRATDEAGLTGTASRTWLVDATPPTVAFTRRPGAFSAASGVRFGWIGADSIAQASELTYSYRLDEGVYSTPAADTTIVLDGLLAGTRGFTVRAHDPAGNVGVPQTWVWQVDSQSPETQIVSGPDGITLHEPQAVFEFTGSDDRTLAADLTFAWRLVPGAFGPFAADTHVVVDGLPDGVHGFEVRARDAVGNVDATPASRTFTVRAEPPAVAILTGPAEGSSTSATTASFTWTLASLSPLADRAATTWSHRLDQAPFGPESPDTFATFTGLTEGAHVLSVRATDDAALDGVATRTWTVDLTAPETQIASGPTSGWAGPGDLVIGVTGTDNVDTPAQLRFRHRLDGGAWSAPSQSPIVIPNPGAGAHTFEVYALDRAGNEDGVPESLAFTVDLGVPTVAIDEGPAEGATVLVPEVTFVVSGTDDMVAPGALVYRHAVDGGAYGPFTPSTSRTISGLGEGAHTFRVQSRDPAGNSSVAETRGFDVHLLPPHKFIVAGPSEYTQATSATFVFSATSTQAPETIEYSHRLDDAGYSPWDTTKTIVFPTLGEGHHTFDLKARDAYGLEDSLRTPFTVDLHPPATSIVNGPPEGGWSNDETPTFAVAGTDALSPPHLLQFSHSVDAGPFTAFATGGSITLAALPEGPHTFTVTSRDPAGNADPGSVSRSWTLDLVPPETEIVAGPAPNAVVDGSSATFSFTGSDLASPEIRFQTRIDGGPWSNVTIATNATRGGLTDGPHVFEVRAVDLAGNVDPSPATRPFVTDALAPAIAFTAGPAEGTCTSATDLVFDWSAPDVVSSPAAVTHAWALDANPFTAYGPLSGATLSAPPEGERTLRVRARDSLGHVATATRTFRVDRTPPTPYAPTALVLDNDTFGVTCTGLDAGGIVSWLVQVSTDPAFATGVRETTIAGSAVSFSGDADSTYYARAAATDCAGNASGFGPVSNGATLFHLPNLEVTAIEASPTSTSGQTFGFEYTVANTAAGSTNVPAWYDDVYLSRTPTFDPGSAVHLARVTNLTYLDAGDTYTVNRTLTLPLGLEGAYYVLVLADRLGHVGETNGGDNTGVAGPVTIALGNYANLVVTQVSAPPTALTGETIRVRWTVQNQGSGRTNQDQWWDTVMLSTDDDFDFGLAAPGLLQVLDTPLGRVRHTGGLDPGESYSDSADVVLPSAAEGRPFVLVVTDLSATSPLQSVPERGEVFEHVAEVNAAASDTMRVIGQEPPDLVVESVALNTPQVHSGGSFQVTWTVRNSGFNDTPATSWTDRVFLSLDAVLDVSSDLEVESLSRSGVLALGQSYSRTRTVNVPHGVQDVFFVFVKTDAHAYVDEYDDDNNVARAGDLLNVQLSDWPNLVPFGGTTPDTVVAGQTALVTWSSGNLGQGASYGQWHDQLWISPSETGLAGGMAVASVRSSRVLRTGDSYGASASFAIPAHLEGAWWAHLVTDHRGELYEHTDEGDNTAPLGSFQVRPYPPVDVAVTDVTLGTLTARTTDPLPVTWTLTNHGTGTTRSGSWSEEVWLSRDLVLDGSDLLLAGSQHLGVMAAGATYTRSVAPAIPYGIGGEFHVIVRTRPEPVDDADPSNDVRAGVVPVSITELFPPNVTVADLEATTPDTSGHPLTARWTTSNSGPGDVTGSVWYTQLYLSQDPRLDGADHVLGSAPGPADLAVGAAVEESLTVTVPVWASGPYYLFVWADPQQRLFEGGLDHDNTAVSPPVFVYLPPSSNLEIRNVVVPPTATPGEPVTITYDIANIGLNQALGSLQNAVYVSRDSAFASVDDPLVGIESRYISLPPGGVAHFAQSVILDRPIQVDAAGGVTANLPSISPGDYFAIVRANIRASVREVSLDDNQSVSATAIVADVASLPLAVTTPFTMTPGQERYYKVTAPPGSDLRITAGSDVPDAVNELRVAFGRTPSGSDFDFSGPPDFIPDPEVLVPDTRDGTYYLQMFARTLGSLASIETATLRAELVPFSIRSHAPAAGGTGGRVTVAIHGAGFRPDTRVTLEQSGAPVVEGRITRYVNTTEMRVRFDLAGTPQGVYDLVADNGAEQVLAPGGFAVEAPSVSPIDVRILNPDVLRRTAIGTFVVTFTNASNHDVPVLTARILASGVSRLRSLETSPGLLGSSERFPDLRAPVTGDAVALVRCDGSDSLLAIDLVGADLAPGESRTATLGLSGFTTSPYSIRVLAEGASVTDYLDRQVALHEAARQALLASGAAPLDWLLLAGDPIRFRDEVLLSNESARGAVLATDVEEYLRAQPIGVAPVIEHPGPTGPLDLLHEAEFGSCEVPTTIPECVPDAGDVRCALPGCVSVFCTKLRVPLASGPAVTEVAVGATSVRGFSHTWCADARIVTPCDPNVISGPAGFGDHHWVTATTPMSYRVDFENLPEVAQVSAQVVRIQVPVDLDLDPTTFRLGLMGFGSHEIEVPPDRTSYSVESFYADLGLRVRVTCAITDRLATWEFTAIDPATGQKPNTTAGFLPPNDQTGRGKGFVTYTIRPYANRPSGADVEAQASIKFDANAELLTSTARNRIDTQRPTSAVASVSSVTDSTRVRVAWQSTDDPGGVGIAGVTLFMRRDLGTFTAVASGLTVTALDVAVQPGHYYSFYTRATDHTGNLEAAKLLPDTVVTVGTPALPVEPAPLPRATALHAAFPNPFSQSTTVRFDLARSVPVSLTVYDLQGRVVERLVSRRVLEAGAHSVTWGGRRARPGVYFVRLQAGDFEAVRRMVRLR